MDFIQKYWHIICEELNVKEIVVLPDQINYSKIYKPIWSKLKQYGAQVSLIIQAGKQGQILELEEWKILIKYQDQERVLNSDEYEIQYDGIDTKTVNIEWDVIVKLDTTIDDALEEEWYIRGICRSLNQMRKEVNYQINQRVKCTITSLDDNFLIMIQNYESDLINEVLLDQIQYIHSGESKSWDITQKFIYNNQIVFFTLDA